MFFSYIKEKLSVDVYLDANQNLNQLASIRLLYRFYGVLFLNILIRTSSHSPQVKFI